MASKLYGATGITGGTDGTVDSIVYSVLADGDIVFAVDSNEDFVVFRFESSSSTSESSPWTTNKVIEPADFGSSDGRWVLSDFLCDELTTYGNVTVNGNVDITGTLTFDAAGPAVTVIKDEDTMTSDSATALCTQQSIKAYVDGVAAGVGIDALAGLVTRPTFGYSSTTAITLNGFRYHHNGSSEQILKNDTTITFTFGSGGSNSASSALGTSQWQYLYIDDSAVVTAASTTVSASELLNSTVAPSWDADQLGWYGDGTGNTQVTDRCIGAFYVTSGGAIEKFYHNGDQRIEWDDEYLFKNGACAAAWTDYTLRMPGCCTFAPINIVLYDNGVQAKAWLYYRAGDSSDGGRIIGRVHGTSGGDDHYINTVTDILVRVGATDNIELYGPGGSTHVARCGQLGYILPQGM